MTYPECRIRSVYIPNTESDSHRIRLFSAALKNLVDHYWHMEIPDKPSFSFDYVNSRRALLTIFTGDNVHHVVSEDPMIEPQWIADDPDDLTWVSVSMSSMEVDDTPFDLATVIRYDHPIVETFLSTIRMKQL